MNRFYIFIILLVVNFVFSQEQNPPPIRGIPGVVLEHDDENYLKVDSLYQHDTKTNNTFYPKSFSDDFKNKYKGDDFDYTLNKPRKSLWERFLNRVFKFIESIFGDFKPNFGFNKNTLIIVLKVLGVILGSLILFFILRFFFDKNRRSIFGKKNAHLDIEAEQLHQNIHEINFPETIFNYELKKDYRSAVRYQFLYLLKKLNSKQLIIWNPEKTNRDYELEINQSLKSQYERLSFIFEYVWYGEFDISEKQYQLFKNEFETVKF